MHYNDRTDTPSSRGGLLPTRQAAAELGLSPRTLERWRVLGTGPVFRRLGRAVRYALVDLEAFAAARVRVRTRDRSDQS